MKRLLKVAIGVCAVVGVAYIGLMLYAVFFLPKCTLSARAFADSPDGEYNATFEHVVCEDRAKSRASVMMGARGREDRYVLFEVQGTTDVRLTWNGNRELIVTIPDAATVKRYNAENGWPRVVERRVANHD